MRHESQSFTVAIAVLQCAARAAHGLEVAAVRSAADDLCAVRAGTPRSDVAFGSRYDF